MTAQVFVDAGPSAFDIFLLIALIWWAVPIAIAVRIARQKGVDLVGAVLMTLVLGWLGVAILILRPDVLGGHDPVEEVGPRAMRTLQDETSARAQTRSPGARLREVDELLDLGAITRDEHKRKREEILRDI